jgi:hypothetical protein
MALPMLCWKFGAMSRKISATGTARHDRETANNTASICMAHQLRDGVINYPHFIEPRTKTTR